MDRFHSPDKIHSNCCYAAIFVYQKFKLTSASLSVKMVSCMVVGCGNKSGRDKGVYFATDLMIRQRPRNGMVRSLGQGGLPALGFLPKYEITIQY